MRQAERKQTAGISTTAAARLRAAQAGTTLKLPRDTYGAGNALIDRTAGAVTLINQIPLPISIDGVVYEDIDLDNQQDSIDPGIGNVQLTLEQWSASIEARA